MHSGASGARCSRLSTLLSARYSGFDVIAEAVFLQQLVSMSFCSAGIRLGCIKVVAKCIVACLQVDAVDAQAAAKEEGQGSKRASKRMRSLDSALRCVFHVLERRVLKSDCISPMSGCMGLDVTS